MTGKVIALHRLQGVPAEMSDEALLGACAVGDNAALAALFDRYQTHVQRFLARLSGTEQQDLDDLVQSTFLEVHRSASRYAGRAQVKTWLFGIAANVARHHARSEHRRRLFAAAYAAQRPAPAAGRLDDAAHNRQQLARLGTALRGLPHDQRVVFVLCDLEDVAGVEAARALGVPEGTLFRRLHDARKRLRAALDAGAP